MKTIVKNFEELYALWQQGVTTGEAVVDAVVECVATHNMIYPEEVATMLEVKDWELRAAFHLLTGMTLREMITQWRYRQAREMILNGKYELKEVAHRCGWRSVRVMDGVFVRMCGQSATRLAMTV